MSWEIIQEGSNKTIVEYDEDRDMYRVSFFDDDWHFLEDVMFDAYNPRKHGEWIEYSGDPNIITCSECDWGTSPEEKSFKFCPNCGADMSKSLSEEIKQGTEYETRQKLIENALDFEPQRKVGFNKNFKKYNIAQRLDGR